MAAIFYNADTTTPVFAKGFQVNTSVRVDFLADMIGSASYAIITSVSVVNNDTVQFFQTFDDIIGHFYFGKGLGAITIGGLLFTNCDGEVPGVAKFYERIGQNRGKPINISFGKDVFTGVISSFSATAVAEPDNTVEWSIVLQMIDHSLPVVPVEPACYD